MVMQTSRREQAFGSTAWQSNRHKQQYTSANPNPSGSEWSTASNMQARMVA
jgi:hypothetical protein